MPDLDPKPDNPLDPLAGIPTPESLANPPRFLSPEESAQAHRALLESAAEAGVAGGPGQSQGSVKEASFEQLFPGENKPGEAERVLKELLTTTKDILETLDGLPEAIAALLSRQ